MRDAEVVGLSKHTISLVPRRLVNHRLSRKRFDEPCKVVAWLGAAQAQDYAAAKWAIGLRADDITDADVEQAFNKGAILRTHLLRPTWHFVAPADIRWMQALTGPRVHTANAHYYRKCGLDSRLFARSRAIFERALQGGNDLTRSDLARVLRRSGIEADGMRLAYLVMHAELDGVICSGARRGKQFTYALLEERVPQARVLEREEALAELTRRYFSSHGPATLRDYVWWSGLTVRDAKAGLDSVKPALVHESFGGRSYWFVAARLSAASAPECTHLLPNYDEYLIAYKDRDPVVAPRRAGTTDVRGDMFAQQLVIDGLLAGRWTRGHGASSVRVDVAPYRRLTRDEVRAIAAAADRYGRFMQLATDVRIVQP